jgi:hypothetical protein
MDRGGRKSLIKLETSQASPSLETQVQRLARLPRANTDSWLAEPCVAKVLAHPSSVSVWPPVHNSLYGINPTFGIDAHFLE